MNPITKDIAFESVENDIFDVKIYTLSNGLKIYLSVNADEPRIQTHIAVKTGSKMDPKETTGLAHYLEHMMFKGTHKIGALDWAKEKEYLDQISDTYEQYRQTDNKEERKVLYKKIDELSFEASKLVATNEYDKIISALGAKGTNAYTSVEQTVYINDIPANELERWMKLESERFNEVVLRLFHTELETVYEEFNISQNVDTRKVNKIIGQTLFPTHPYGTQTTLGSSEHLQNPSMVNIMAFFDKYYVPNNMAIVASGDFDPTEFVQMAEQYFGQWKTKDVTPLALKKQKPLDAIKRIEVQGNEAPFVDLAWSCGGTDTDHPIYLDLIRSLLFNGHAGLIDLNLVQSQQLLEADAWIWPFKDYSVFGLYAAPRKGQSFEEAEALLIEQIELLKRGEFPDWLIDAVVKNKKLQELKSFDSNQARTGYMTAAFVKDLPWTYAVDYFDNMAKITKAEVQAFCQEHFNDNYVFVAKKTGEDSNLSKVPKPDITPIEINRNVSSEFATDLFKNESPSLEPQFLDYPSLIQSEKLKDGLQLDYVENKLNGLFSLYYIFEFGKDADNKLPVAMRLFKYLGTKDYSTRQLKEEFFKLGITYDVFSSNDRTYVTISGLNESFEEGITLFEHLINNVEPDAEALANVIDDLIQTRLNNKKDKSFVLRHGMMNYAKFGKDNPFTNSLSEEALAKLDINELTAMIQKLCTIEHKLYYFGPSSQADVKAIITKHHTPASALRAIPVGKVFEELSVEQSVVNIVHFPIVQAETLMVAPIHKGYDVEEHIMSELYNSYFGLGLSSIVFQEIRESKALAYSTYAYYSLPSKPEKKSYIHTFVGTQPDKLDTALTTMHEIVEDMPESEDQFQNARISILKKLENDRIAPKNYYWTFDKINTLGLDKDITEQQYQMMQNVTLKDLVEFQKNKVKGRAFNYLILGDKDQLDLDALGKIGQVNVMTIEDVLGY